ncbi:hypothetical protein [Hydrogenimonas urashimensis]|uniref:hypothetical protein n=1 Tax=Hydrogenimonas urashimensis TaxID=2740515 RepID=UPI001916A2AE|nr:hypothetical protein [Hydrogenimonas urashimensis]
MSNRREGRPKVRFTYSLIICDLKTTLSSKLPDSPPLRSHSIALTSLVNRKIGKSRHRSCPL